MKKKTLWKILLILGILPFVMPFLIGLYRMSIESWTMVDWLILYSFVYWPTYVAGVILIMFAVLKLLSNNEEEDRENDHDSKTDR